MSKTDMILDALDQLNKTDAKIDELLGALEHIAEYWNQDQNESAMVDALWHIIETAEQAIAKAKGK